MQAEVMLLESGGNVLDLNPSDAGVVNALRVWEDQRQPPWMHLVERALPTVAFDKRKRKEAQEDVQELLMQEITAPAVKIELNSHSFLSDTGMKDVDLGRVLKRAATDAGVVRCVNNLRLAGLWSDDLPVKQEEPVRAKAHWDYLLDECVWLAKEVAGERRWKQKVAKRVAIAARKGLQEMRVVTGGSVGSVFESSTVASSKEGGDFEMRAISHTLASMVCQWWGSIQELLVHKRQAALELKKRAVLSKHLDLVVDQTAALGGLVSQALRGSSVTPSLAAESALAASSLPQSPVTAVASRGAPALGDDDQFQEGDDEDELDTLLAAEAGEDREEVKVEVDALQREMDMDMDALLAQYQGYRLGGTGSSSDESGHESDSDEEGGPMSESAEEGNHNGTIKPSVPPMEALSTAEPPSKRRKEALDNDGNKDFEVQSDEDEMGTLLAEEANEDRAEVALEVDALQMEMDMDMNALLAQYGNYRPVGGSESASASQEDVDDSDLDDDVNEKDEQDELDEEGSLPLNKDEPLLYGTHLLLAENDLDGRSIMEGAAREAQTAQPTGITLATCKVRTPMPALLRGPPLREYQHIGLDWLVAMYEKGLNGILADEMGLGKTVMTISLLAHLAEKRGIWGPHLIVVPTSVLLNWEKEFKFWHPAFKILTYFGSQKQRHDMRKGWYRPNSFHVCLTTYNIILQDSSVFRRRQWQYLILDEAHNIRNFKSKRWVTLLALRARRRLLLTGTPLQNNLMELWSLLHFLMPHIFQSHSEFKEWFAAPMDAMIEGKQQVDQLLIDRLHSVLRPFLLRRLKKDVETQLPDKHEHVVLCQLSKRQRGLYEEFLASRRVRDTLEGGNVVGVMNILMQLRKVCNHPDLFEERPIISPYDIPEPLTLAIPRAVLCDFPTVMERVVHPELPSWYSQFLLNRVPDQLIAAGSGDPLETAPLGCSLWPQIAQGRINDFLRGVKRNVSWSQRRAWVHSSLSSDVVRAFTMHRDSHTAELNIEREALRIAPLVTFVIPRARARSAQLVYARPRSASEENDSHLLLDEMTAASPNDADSRAIFVRQQLYFPDKRLVQYDCGKLQELAGLLARLQSEGHRVLIFTQMTRMLDVLETFLTFHHYTYLRLDGATRTDRRYAMMERFNEDRRIFCFILSTRSGGIGINLTGADTVIFFDSDWNPAMDAQAQDRCHRIGQTRTVHIYRLISAKTVEENILRKAWQKRQLERVTLAEGGFNVSALGDNRVDLRELIGDGAGGSLTPSLSGSSTRSAVKLDMGTSQWNEALAAVEDDADREAAQAALAEVADEAHEFDQQAPAAAALSTNLHHSKLNSAPCEPMDEEGKLEHQIVSQLGPVQRFAYRYCAALLELADDGAHQREKEALLERERQWERDFRGNVHREQIRRQLDPEQALSYVPPSTATASRVRRSVYGPPMEREEEEEHDDDENDHEDDGDDGHADFEDYALVKSGKALSFVGEPPAKSLKTETRKVVGVNPRRNSASSAASHRKGANKGN